MMCYADLPRRAGVETFLHPVQRVGRQGCATIAFTEFTETYFSGRQTRPTESLLRHLFQDRCPDIPHRDRPYLIRRLPEDEARYIRLLVETRIGVPVPWPRPEAP
jgi:hypothetical protein